VRIEDETHGIEIRHENQAARVMPPRGFDPPVFLFGHLGVGLGLVWLVASQIRRKPDYRPVLLGTILPDLIDKPLGAALGLDSRLWGHTLAFFAILVLLDRLPALRGIGWLGGGVGTHFLLDQIWETPAVVLWPSLGWAFPNGALSVEFYWYVLLHDPVVQLGEAAGIAILIGFAWTQGIRSWDALRSFIRRGAVARASWDPK